MHRIRLTVAALMIVAAGCGPQRSLERPNTLAQDGATEHGFFKHANGRLLRWKNLPVVFSFSSDFPQNFNEACQTAAAIINESVGQDAIQFYDEPSSSSNNIGFGSITGSGHEQAQTKMTFMENWILKAEIIFDDQNFPFSTDPDSKSVDVESICLHEMGHALGLAHSDERDSIMHETLGPGQLRRQLTELDLSNLRSVY